MSVTANSTIATTTSMAGTNHKLVRRTSLRQCEASADDGTPRYMFGILSRRAAVTLAGGTMPRPVAHLANLDLNLLVALRERSVTRAAERLGVTQPAAEGSAPGGLRRRRRHRPVARATAMITLHGRTAVPGYAEGEALVSPEPRLRPRMTLTLPPRGLFGLCGPNGADKSTLLSVIGGSVPPACGRVLLDGADVTRLPPQQRFGLGISRTFQAVHLIRGRTVLDNVAVACLTSHRSGIASRLFPQRTRPGQTAGRTNPGPARHDRAERPGHLVADAGKPAGRSAPATCPLHLWLVVQDSHSA